MSRTVVRLLLAVLLAACGGDPPAEPPAPPPRVASLDFDSVPPAARNHFVLRRGDAFRLVLLARDSAGNRIARPAVEWRARPHPHYAERGEAAVDSAGRITGVSPGWVEVSAYAGGIGAIAAVYVRTPVAAVSLGADSVRVVAGAQRSLGLVLRDSAGRAFPVASPVALTTTDAAVATLDSSGLLRTGREGRATVSASVDGVTARVAVTVSAARLAQLAHGRGFACGVDRGGEVLCWGENGMSQLGGRTPTRCVGSVGQRCGMSPTEIPQWVSGGGRFAQVSAGGRHACALTAAGAAWCWGKNGTGELGTSQTLRDCYDLAGGSEVGPCTETPTAVETGETFTAISAGTDATCALAADGRAWCWGGVHWTHDGTRWVEQRGSRVPTAVPGGRAFRSVSTGENHACALTAAGEPWCWGTNASGELGTGTADTDHHATPERVVGGLTFVAIGAGDGTSCGLTNAGGVHCWGAVQGLGRAEAPELCPRPSVPGVPSEPLPCSTRPVPVESDRTFTALAVAAGASCALDADGAPWCWDLVTRVPARVTGAPPLRTLTAGGYSSGCGLSRGDDVAYCWSWDRVARRLPGQP